MVASHYPNHPQPLWNLPGGRQQPGELLAETVVREFFEETRLRVTRGELAYVSESYDGDAPFPQRDVSGASFDGRVIAGDDALRSRTITSWRWSGCRCGEVRDRIVVAVVREPLLAYLQGVLPRRYAGFHDAGITIEWPPGSA